MSEELLEDVNNLDLGRIIERRTDVLKRYFQETIMVEEYRTYEEYDQYFNEKGFILTSIIPVNYLSKAIAHIFSYRI